MLELLMTALLIGGEPQPACPHRIAVPVNARVEPLLLRECGSGITVNTGGTTMSTTQCPLIVIVTPAHAQSQASENSNTFTEPAGQLAVKRLHYACETGYLLWILPILGSSCVFKGEVNAGAVTHYVQQPCVAIVVPPAEKTS